MRVAGGQIAELGAPLEEYRAGWWWVTFIAVGALSFLAGLFFATILILGALTDAHQKNP